MTDLSPLLNQTSLQALGVNESPALTNLDVLPPMTGLTYLSANRSSLVHGLRGLSDCAPRLTHLIVGHSFCVDDLRPLTALRLEWLELWGCRRVTDFAPLAALTSLYHLDLEDTNIDDLTPLDGLAELETLWLRDCEGVTDLTPLGGLRKLRKLYIRGVAPAIDLAPLVGLSKLTVYIDHGQEVRNGKLLGRRLRVG